MCEEMKAVLIIFFYLYLVSENLIFLVHLFNTIRASFPWTEVKIDVLDLWILFTVICQASICKIRMQLRSANQQTSFEDVGWLTKSKLYALS